MDDKGNGLLGVWRVGRRAQVGGFVLAGAPAFAAVAAWLSALVHRDAEHARSAAALTGIAVGFGLFAWWSLLRVRLELTTEVIVMVNPWGTQRLPWSHVSAVSLGNWGAQFHTPDGFKYTAYALSDIASGTRQDERFAAMRQIAEARLLHGNPA